MRFIKWLAKDIAGGLRVKISLQGLTGMAFMELNLLIQNLRFCPLIGNQSTTTYLLQKARLRNLAITCNTYLAN